MSIPGETIEIDTPENVTFGYQVAGIGSRFLATLLDTLLVILLQILVFAAFALVINILGQSAKDLTTWAIAFLGFISFIFYSGYYVFFEMLWNGQTPGKRWVGLRVIRIDGTPITLSESFIRNLARLVDFLPAAYGIGIISMFLDKQSRRLGDLAAGTLVIHDRAPVSIQSLSMNQPTHYQMQSLSKISLDGFPLERLTNDDLNMIENFLRRREQLTHRGQLAIQIVNTLHTRFNLPLPSISRFQAEDMLIAILQKIQNNTEEN
jgi:uncharacterized RDD family membrane protein YckC